MATFEQPQIPEQRQPAADLTTEDKFDFRQDFGIGNSRERITATVALRALECFPEYDIERCDRIGKTFADIYGTFMGAVRRGFLEGTADHPLEMEFTVDGFTMPVRVIHPREDPRHTGYRQTG